METHSMGHTFNDILFLVQSNTTLQNLIITHNCIYIHSHFWHVPPTSRHIDTALGLADSIDVSKHACTAILYTLFAVKMQLNIHIKK